MKKYFPMLLTVLIPAPALVMLTLATSAAQQDNTKKPAKTVCLACHGSFDKLAASTADYEAPSGEKTSPHKYVPHTDKKDIPECTECHTPHPVPIQDKEAVLKANIDYCYTGCHHPQNLQACNTCH